MPLILFLYMFDRDSIIDSEKSDGDINYPQPGLPTRIARFSQMLGIMWGDYSYLIDDSVYDLSLKRIILMWIFGWVQLLTSVFAKPIIILWAIISFLNMLL